LDRAQAIAVAAAEAEEVFAKEGRVLTSEDSRAAIPSAATWKPKAKALEEPGSPSSATQEPENIDDEVEPLEDLEHLQLTMQEAWFLVWTMDCLTVLDPTTVRVVLSYRKYDTFCKHPW
jgi:tRNA-splicing endonuclease subunit Sen2